ncbi:MAG: tRNA adenosine(34) deaminase TadA [Nitrospirae bacterium]|nr:tRNA adenosine(34) deaminase TadA [Nitrospirota bacterium]
MKDDEYFMQLALEEAKKAYQLDEVPVGALVVKEGEVISRAYNQRESLNDPTAHAELIAIREASKRLGNWRLTDTTLYVTKEPCPMCAGAIVGARIKRLVYGCKDKKGGAVESLYTIASDPRLNHQVEITSGVLEPQCRELLQSFFRAKRVPPQTP